MRGDHSRGERYIVDLQRFLCSVAHQQKIFYLWRPILPDPKDDMVLELAVGQPAGGVTPSTVERRGQLTPRSSTLKTSVDWGGMGP